MSHVNIACHHRPPSRPAPVILSSALKQDNAPFVKILCFIKSCENWWLQSSCEDHVNVLITSINACTVHDHECVPIINMRSSVSPNTTTAATGLTRLFLPSSALHLYSRTCSIQFHIQYITENVALSLHCLIPPVWVTECQKCYTSILRDILAFTNQLATETYFIV